MIGSDVTLRNLTKSGGPVPAPCAARGWALMLCLENLNLRPSSQLGIIPECSATSGGSIPEKLHISVTSAFRPCRIPRGHSEGPLTPTPNAPVLTGRSLQWRGRTGTPGPRS